MSVVDFPDDGGPVNSVGVFLKSREPHMWELIRKDYEKDPAWGAICYFRFVPRIGEMIQFYGWRGKVEMVVTIAHSETPEIPHVSSYPVAEVWLSYCLPESRQWATPEDSE